jgi:hypothetical protein
VDLLINREDLHEIRIADSEPPEPEDGQALLRVETFGLTANNTTYALLGEAMSYWKFFPTSEQGWGRMPVWGFAEVADANGTGLEDGLRIYGYLPSSTHLVVQPARVDERAFRDGAPHRAELPSAYQGYRNVAADPAYREDREDEQMVFWPLFYTSWLIDDFLADESCFGAGTILLGSASSKTAVIAAYMLAQREDLKIVGLTSPGNLEFVEGLGIYDAAVTYGEIGGLDRERAVYVDMSGDGEIRRSVHERFGDDLAHSCVVGASHWNQVASGGQGPLPGPNPEFFFAPTRITKRTKDWSPAELDERVVASWKPFVEWAHGWLEIERSEGPEGLKAAYLEVLDGGVAPNTAHVVSLDG